MIDGWVAGFAGALRRSICTRSNAPTTLNAEIAEISEFEVRFDADGLRSRPWHRDERSGDESGCVADRLIAGSSHPGDAASRRRVESWRFCLSLRCSCLRAPRALRRSSSSATGDETLGGASCVFVFLVSSWLASGGSQKTVVPRPG